MKTPKNYSITNKVELLDMLQACQVGEMTCLRAIEYIEPQVEALTDKIFSLEGVISAVDRALWGDPKEQLERFAKGQIHASRAIAIQNIINERDHLKAMLAKQP